MIVKKVVCSIVNVFEVKYFPKFSLFPASIINKTKFKTFWAASIDGAAFFCFLNRHFSNLVNRLTTPGKSVKILTWTKWLYELVIYWEKPKVALYLIYPR